MEETQLVLLGPPACGKGTQGKMLAGEFGLRYFSTGKQLRREVKAGTDLGVEADRYLSRTEFVPDELVLRLVSEWIGSEEGGWILDGFPRTLPQALEFDRVPEGQGVRALLIDVGREELEARAAERCECVQCHWGGTRDCLGESGNCPACGGEVGQRRDDEPGAFRKRMDLYEELTVPVVEHYSGSGRLWRVSGVGSPEEVFTRVRDAIVSHGEEN